MTTKSIAIRNAMRFLARAVARRETGCRGAMRVCALSFRSHLAASVEAEDESNRLFKQAMDVPLLFRRAATVANTTDREGSAHADQVPHTPQGDYSARKPGLVLKTNERTNYSERGTRK